ncbi:MAG TPA: L-histidine N(alpha)-methyltransferase [Nitrososphaera sp.]|jgi:dimethylhistidine N-methyltransferase|nr:L-histidine N(alpha)-methyltransferase [Nitrososphaera sp.]
MLPQNKKQEARTDLASEFALDISLGLSGKKKFIPFKYFYDRAGSELFGQICLQQEYYPTRTEAAILAECSPRIAELANNNNNNNCISVIELGSGSSTKTRILLKQIVAASRRRVLYLPIDISSTILQETATRLRSELGISVIAVQAEYGEGMRQADKILIRDGSILPRKIVIFLGSSIGNFEPGEAASFLSMVKQSMDKGDFLLVSFDLHKDRCVLEAAYNDKKGITARFNLNLLERINNELEGQFDLDKFAHMAFYNEPLRRIEMHLVSKKDQDVYIGILDKSFHFEEGETIHTENSYKYDMDQIKDIATASGFTLKEHFMDAKKWFCLALFTPSC